MDEVFNQQFPRVSLGGHPLRVLPERKDTEWKNAERSGIFLRTKSSGTAVILQCHIYGNKLSGVVDLEMKRVAHPSAFVQCRKHAAKGPGVAHLVIPKAPTRN